MKSIKKTQKIVYPVKSPCWIKEILQGKLLFNRAKTAIIAVSIIAYCLLPVVNCFPQAPQGFNYQGVARDTTGFILAIQSIGIKISILQDSAAGTTLYSEEHNTTTDDFGVFDLAIGSGTVLSGAFSPINWGGSAHFVKIEVDETGDTTYKFMGVMQLLSVPYSLYAENAGSDNDWTMDADTLYSAADSTVTIKGGNVGIGTTVPQANLAVMTYSGDPGMYGTNVPGLFARNAGGIPTFNNDFPTIYTRVGIIGAGVQPILDGQTTAIGLAGFAENSTNGGNAVGVFAKAQAKSGIADGGANFYGIYSVATKNYFSGNVGIGTTTPETKLDIEGGAILLDNNQYLSFENSVGGNISVITVDGTNDLLLKIDGNNELKFNTNATQQMVIDGSGNVGIGTTSPDGKFNVSAGGDTAAFVVNATTGKVGIGTTGPATKLHVSGNTLIGTHTSYLSNGTLEIRNNAADASIAIYGSSGRRLKLSQSSDGTVNVTDGDLVLSTGNGDVVLSPTNGNVGIGTTSPGAKLSVQTTGTTDILNLIETAGDTVFTVLESGNVGIGTTSPGSKLQVWSWNEPVSKFNFYSGFSNLSKEVLRLYNEYAGANIFDGFGAHLSFSISDIAGSEQEIAQIRAIREGADNSGKLEFHTFNAGSGSAKMTILKTGNVGIGTTTPSGKFNVSAGGDTTALVVDATTGNVGIGMDPDNIVTLSVKTDASANGIRITNGTGSSISLNANSGSPGNPYMMFTDGITTTLLDQLPNGHFVIGNPVGPPFLFEMEPSTTAMGIYIKSNGNVGIGTTNPTSKLQVVGLPIYVDNAAAITGGLTVGAFYHAGDGIVRVVF